MAGSAVVDSVVIVVAVVEIPTAEVLVTVVVDAAVGIVVTADSGVGVVVYVVTIPSQILCNRKIAYQNKRAKFYDKTAGYDSPPNLV